MKKLLIMICLSLAVMGLFGEEGDSTGLYVESLNIGGSFKVPVSHYRGFSEYEAGFAIQTNYKLHGLKVFRVFWGIDGTYNLNSTPRIDHLIDAAMTVGLGLVFNPGGGGFTISPQLSAGAIFHVVNGDFMMNGNRGTSLYVDQLYRFQLEMAYTFKAGEKKRTHVGVFLSPSFEVFPGETYWGFVPGGTAGIRFQFDPAI